MMNNYTLIRSFDNRQSGGGEGVTWCKALEILKTLEKQMTQLTSLLHIMVLYIIVYKSWIK